MVPAGSSVGDDHGGAARVRPGTVRGTAGRSRVSQRMTIDDADNDGVDDDEVCESVEVGSSRPRELRRSNA